MYCYKIVTIVTKFLRLNQPSFISHPWRSHRGSRGLSRAVLLQGVAHNFTPLLTRGTFISRLEVYYNCGREALASAHGQLRGACYY